MRHAYRDVFVGHGHCLRQVDALAARLDQSLDDRREVRSGIREHVADAKRLQLAKQRSPGCQERGISTSLHEIQSLHYSLA